MSKLKRDLKRESIPEKTTRGTEITTACTGNAAIGTVTAELAAFTTANGGLGAAVGALATAHAAVDTAIINQDTAEQAWDAAFEALCIKLESNTTGDKAKLTTTTIPTYEPGAGGPASTPAQVLALSATTGDMPREIDLQWNALRNPKPNVHLVFMCDDPYDLSKMQQIGTPTASKFTAKPATPGKKWFQVCAVYTGGQQGPWSDPATGTAI
ncbi:MAG: hypothetical protein ABI318_22925 [Chthoniobacteraceae bacterium]